MSGLLSSFSLFVMILTPNSKSISFLVRPEGVEPSTPRLKGECSTAELRPQLILKNSTKNNLNLKGWIYFTIKTLGNSLDLTMEGKFKMSLFSKVFVAKTRRISIKRLKDGDDAVLIG